MLKVINPAPRLPPLARLVGLPAADIWKYLQRPVSFTTSHLKAIA